MNQSKCFLNYLCDFLLYCYLSSWTWSQTAGLGLECVGLGIGLGLTNTGLGLTTAGLDISLQNTDSKQLYRGISLVS